MDIFSNSAKRFKFTEPSLDSAIYPATLGMVYKIKDRFRCDVMLNSGELHEDVRFYGPAILERGSKAHGRAGGIQINQLVLVEFVRGSFRSPIIVKTYPFYAKDDDLENIRDFWKEYSSFINLEDDIVDFHKSGYFVRQTNDKIQFYDSQKIKIGEVDFLLKKLTWTLQEIDIESTNVKIKGDVSIEGNVTAKGDFEIEGDVSVDGKINSTGVIESDADVKAIEISLTGHTHQYSPGPLSPVPTSPPQ